MQHTVQLMDHSLFVTTNLFEQAFLLQAAHDSRPHLNIATLCNLVKRRFVNAIWPNAIWSQQQTLDAQETHSWGVRLDRTAVCGHQMKHAPLPLPTALLDATNLQQKLNLPSADEHILCFAAVTLHTRPCMRIIEQAPTRPHQTLTWQVSSLEKSTVCSPRLQSRRVPVRMHVYTPETASDDDCMATVAQREGIR